MILTVLQHHLQPYKIFRLSFSSSITCQLCFVRKISTNRLKENDQPKGQVMTLVLPMKGPLRRDQFYKWLIHQWIFHVNTVLLPYTTSWQVPWRLSGRVSASQCRRRRRRGFEPLVGKVPWWRKWQPTPVFLLGKSHGQRSLVGYSACRSQRVGHDLATEYTHTHVLIQIRNFRELDIEVSSECKTNHPA